MYTRYDTVRLGLGPVLTLTRTPTPALALTLTLALSLTLTPALALTPTLILALALALTLMREPSQVTRLLPPISPYICPYLPTSAHISRYLPGQATRLLPPAHGEDSAVVRPAGLGVGVGVRVVVGLALGEIYGRYREISGRSSLVKGRRRASG